KRFTIKQIEKYLDTRLKGLHGRHAQNKGKDNICLIYKEKHMHTAKLDTKNSMSVHCSNTLESTTLICTKRSILFLSTSLLPKRTLAMCNFYFIFFLFSSNAEKLK
uniref:Uncharacterized protein n=1 Tax=Periophthalmus magnuspinnatus TaxID=409849 RepID=A0A3B3Z9V8_9GOBI